MGRKCKHSENTCQVDFSLEGVRNDNTESVKESGWRILSEALLCAVRQGRVPVLQSIFPDLLSPIEGSPASQVAATAAVLLQQCLMASVLHSQLEVLHLLLQLGADPFLIGPEGGSAFALAVSRGCAAAIVVFSSQALFKGKLRVKCRGASGLKSYRSCWQLRWLLVAPLKMGDGKVAAVQMLAYKQDPLEKSLDHLDSSPLLPMSSLCVKPPSFLTAHLLPLHKLQQQQGTQSWAGPKQALLKVQPRRKVMGQWAGPPMCADAELATARGRHAELILRMGGKEQYIRQLKGPRRGGFRAFCLDEVSMEFAALDASEAAEKVLRQFINTCQNARRLTGSGQPIQSDDTVGVPSGAVGCAMACVSRKNFLSAKHQPSKPTRIERLQSQCCFNEMLVMP